MRRLVLVGAFIALITSFAAWGSVSAGPAPSTTVLLVCDRAANAQVTLQLEDSIFPSIQTGNILLACGPDSPSGSRRVSAKVTTNFQVGAVNVSQFTVQTASFNGGCPGASITPAKLSCPLNGSTGATLTVR